MEGQGLMLNHRVLYPAEMTHLQAGLSPETIEKARLELNENPDILHQDIQQVRDMIITRPDIGFLRTDDAFILRFLRARKFHQTEAFRLLAQYFQYRQLNLDMFKNFKADDPGIKRALTDGFPGVLENRDHCGRKILLLFAANWDQSRNSFIDILRAILLSLEVLIEDQELQINGFILIIDWSNFSFKQASKLTPSILKLAIEGLQKNGCCLWAEDVQEIYQFLLDPSRGQRSSAQTLGLKRERVSSKNLLLLLCTTCPSLGSTWKPHSRWSAPDVSMDTKRLSQYAATFQGAPATSSSIKRATPPELLLQTPPRQDATCILMQEGVCAQPRSQCSALPVSMEPSWCAPATPPLISLSHPSSSPEYADSFPARFGGVHFVNQPWYIHALYTLIKPFLKDKTRKRIFLHGNNLNSLHQLIHPECLPSEFGGTLPPYDMGTWARTLLGPDYSDENEYTHTSYNAMHVKHTSSNLEREASPKPMKRLGVNRAGRAHLARKGAADELANIDSRERFTLG
ncbi:Clavesin-1 [Aix galericulata]|nr:Clavesin-1 [Aix galericulata]